MRANYNRKAKKIKSPASAYPELIAHIAEVSVLVDQLKALTSSYTLAEYFQVTPQAIALHLKKAKERKNDK